MSQQPIFDDESSSQTSDGIEGIETKTSEEGIIYLWFFERFKYFPVSISISMSAKLTLTVQLRQALYHLLYFKHITKMFHPERAKLFTMKIKYRFKKKHEHSISKDKNVILNENLSVVRMCERDK